MKILERNQTWILPLLSSIECKKTHLGNTLSYVLVMISSIKGRFLSLNLFFFFFCYMARTIIRNSFIHLFPGNFMQCFHFQELLRILLCRPTCKLVGTSEDFLNWCSNKVKKQLTELPFVLNVTIRCLQNDTIKLAKTKQKQTLIKWNY